MMVFARGVAKWVSGGQKISTAVQQTDGIIQICRCPPIFNSYQFQSPRRQHHRRDAHLPRLPADLLDSSCQAASRPIPLRHRRQRRSRPASGVPVRLVKILAYGLSGLFCAVAGICQAAQELQGDPEAGIAYELSAIAMVVIGGTSLQGGRGGIWLTLIGVLTIGYLEKILSINAVGEDKRLMLTGAIIIAAVLFQKTRK